MSAMGFVPDVLFLTITFYFMYKYRFQIAERLMKINLSPCWLAFLISIPLIIIEESINTNDHGLFISIIIILILIIQMAILLYYTKKKKCISIKKPLLWYMSLGTLWELVFGGLVGILGYPIVLVIFMVFFYVPLSYAYFAVIPLTILIEKQKIK